MCPYRSMSRNHLYYYTSWPHWVLNIDTFSVELITKSTLTIRTHCLATNSLFRGTLGRFIIICGPFQSYPIPIPAFHLSTGTLWNPFLHFRFIDQHGSSYSIERMVESRSVHEEWLFGETIPANKGSKNGFSPICYAVQSASLFHFPKHNCFRFTHSNANSSNDSLFHCL